MKRVIRASLLLAVTSILAFPAAASAQYYYRPARAYYGRPAYAPPPIDRPGVYLGFAGIGDIVANQANSPTGDFIGSGGGGAVFLGVRLNPTIALEFGVGETLHNGVQDALGFVNYLYLTSVTGDLKLFFPNPSNVRPYVQGGLGFYGLGYSWGDEAVMVDQTFTSGVGFQLGGGLDIWLNPWWSLGGRLLYHGIYFTDVGGNKPFLSTVSLEANLQLHF
jgi:hypothetical protein